MSASCRELFGKVRLASVMYGEVGLVSGLIRLGRVSVGMCSTKSALCRDLFDEVVLVSGRVGRGRVSVGTCSARLA